MPNDYWPLAQLKLATSRLELRVPNDEELSELARVAASGVHELGEQPFLTPWTDLPPRERALHVMQQHWNRRVPGALKTGHWKWAYSEENNR